MLCARIAQDMFLSRMIWDRHRGFPGLPPSTRKVRGVPYPYLQNHSKVCKGARGQARTNFFKTTYGEKFSMFIIMPL